MPASLGATLDGVISRRLTDASCEALAEGPASIVSGFKLCFASLLGGLLRASTDPDAMARIARLLTEPAMAGGMLSRIHARAKPLLEEQVTAAEAAIAGGTVLAPPPPSDPALALGGRLTGATLGSERAGIVRLIADASGLHHTAADALMGLAAPMVLAALQHRLAGGPTDAPQISALMSFERRAILAAIPPDVRRLLDLRDEASGSSATAGRTLAAGTLSGSTMAVPTRSDPLVMPRIARLPDVVTPGDTRQPISPPVAAGAALAVPADRPDGRGPGTRTAAVESTAGAGWASLIPALFALAIFALLAILFWPHSPRMRGAGDGEASDRPATTQPAAGEAASAAGRAVVRRLLPNGSALEIPADGFESRLLESLDDPWRFLASPKWLDIEGLNFETGSAAITADTRIIVQRLAEVLKAYPTVKIKIGGYTDNQGDAVANKRLSEERAGAVRTMLRDLGIASDRLDAEGYGDANPIASNATAEGRARNRRIAVILTQR